MKRIRSLLLAAVIAIASIFPVANAHATAVSYDASLGPYAAYATISGPSAYYEIMLLSVQVSIDGSGSVKQPQQWIRTGTVTFLDGTRYPNSGYMYASCHYRFYKDYTFLDDLYRTAF